MLSKVARVDFEFTVTDAIPKDELVIDILSYILDRACCHMSEFWRNYYVISTISRGDCEITWINLFYDPVFMLHRSKYITRHLSQSRF